ncbi:MAG: glycerol-3-phosphate responsive antiterminator, partial [Clostridia bacterium]|nr:glycerol-3-phosphate responsive antiterminator [Clostridia bacterium]
RDFQKSVMTGGIGKDKAGVEFLAKAGADGIISTKTNIIRFAKEKRIFAVQRIFAPDSQGVNSAAELVKTTNPDFLEVMPGVAYKAVQKLALVKIPVIAGGLIETKAEVQKALSFGAVAVSTGKKELWD